VALKEDRRKVQVAELQAALAAIYTPSLAIDDPHLFSGRSDLVSTIRLDLPNVGKHYVLYGERGAGKTSLWQVLLHGRPVQRHAASVNDDFVSIFLRVLEQLGEQFTADQRKSLSEVSGSLGMDGVASVGGKVGDETTEKPIAMRLLDLNFVLDRVAERADSLYAIVIDEFQRISVQAVQTQIMEVVKGFADRKIDVRIFLVGVADSDDELVPSQAYQESKGRHFVTHRVPLMARDELHDIIDIREARFRVGFDEQVKADIVRIAGGYPWVAHQLALNAAQCWIARAFLAEGLNRVLAFFRVDLPVKRAGVHVEAQDLRRAVQRYIKQFRDDHRLQVQAYARAVLSKRRAAVDRVIAALASSQTTRTPSNHLAQCLGISNWALDVLLDDELRGMVARTNGDCHLTVRTLGTFIAAQRYLVAPDKMISSSTQPAPHVPALDAYGGGA